jgi:hypothetical protein
MALCLGALFVATLESIFVFILPAAIPAVFPTLGVCAKTGEKWEAYI